MGIVRFQIMDNLVALSSVTKDLEVKTEKMILYHGGHQSIYTEDFFISDHFFTIMHPKDNINMYITSIFRKLHSVFSCYLTHVIRVSFFQSLHFPLQSWTSTGSSFLCPFIELMSETVDFHVMKYTGPRFLSAQKESFSYREFHLGRGTIAYIMGSMMT